jgi:hypothetical protein
MNGSAHLRVHGRRETPSGRIETEKMARRRKPLAFRKGGRPRLCSCGQAQELEAEAAELEARAIILDLSQSQGLRPLAAAGFFFAGLPIEPGARRRRRRGRLTALFGKFAMLPRPKISPPASSGLAPRPSSGRRGRPSKRASCARAARRFGGGGGFLFSDVIDSPPPKLEY